MVIDIQIASKLMTLGTSNACVQRGRERHSKHDKKLAARPPLQRLVRRHFLESIS